MKASVVACQDSGILAYVLPRNPVTGAREIRIIPEFVEKVLGNLLYPAMIASQGGHYFKNGHVDMVQGLGKKLIPYVGRSDLPWQFSVIDSNQINAWCMPGGKVAFYEGIIRSMDHDRKGYGVGQFTLKEKMAAVMGHEMTHAAARHSARGMELAIFIKAVLIVVKASLLNLLVDSERRARAEGRSTDTGELVRVVDQVFERCDSLIFSLATSCGSRHREFEADRYGMVAMHRAGYNPKAAIWVQHHLAQYKRCTGIHFLDRVLNLFESHPRGEERIRENEKTLKMIKSGELK